MRSLHPTSIAVLAALVIGTAASVARPAFPGPLADTTGILTPWRIEPAHPCGHDPVFMIVRGFVATPCDSFLDAVAIDSLHVRIRTQVYADRACFAAPSQFYPVPVALGRFAAGPHAGLVEVETIHVRQDSISTRTTQQFRFDFVVAPDCEIQPPGPGPPPFVTGIGTDPEQPCSGRPTSLVVSGVFTDDCGRIVDANSEHFEMTLKPWVLPDTTCTLATVPWRQPFDLGLLSAGLYHATVTVYELFPDSAGTGFVRRAFRLDHQLYVRGSCDSVPPMPSPGPLPYVSEIIVGQGICGPQPVCPGDSILVRVLGTFPNGCFTFRGFQVIPSPATVVPPLPPTLRMIVDDNGCITQLCTPDPVPWTAQVKLPPMPLGQPGLQTYKLPVELAQVTCSDTYPPGQLYRTEVPFTVADSCPEPAPCLNAHFLPGASECNATLSPTHPAALTFIVTPHVALAGLQGEFELSNPALQVAGVEAIGPASGMLLSWTRTQAGAKVLLFAASGAPIPPWPPRDSTRGPGQDGGWPVLRITVTQAGPALPDRSTLLNNSLLGSDIRGQAVPICPPPPCVDVRLAAPLALICSDQACDFNTDGLEDIRDLVLMVHCVSGEGECPPGANVRFDCDGDSTLAIADVICCARDILGRPRCSDCGPDSGTVRPEPSVSVSFGSPLVSADGIALPVRVNGSSRLGAAMLTLDLPLDRYEVAGFDVNPARDWLTLHNEQGGRLVLGMIGLRNAVPPLEPNQSTFMLRLRLRPGASPGGIVTATAGEFSGPDGVTLRVSLGQPTQALPGGAGAALGANQPNPFSRETAFTLDVAQPGDAKVTIFDLRGRVVATLHRAPLEAGPHVFKWNGRQDDGSAAPNGIYFYQATVAGQSYARKLILMRGN